MFIKSLDIQNIYSFGSSGTKDFNDLARVNLIIGSNGSGKSNIAKTLIELPVNDIGLGHSIIGEENYWQSDYQYLEIELDNGIILTQPSNEINGYTQNKSGQFSIFKEDSYKLFQELRDSIFYYQANYNKKFNLNIDDYTKEWVQFGMYYILGKEITINSEFLDEYKIKSGSSINTRGGHSLKDNNTPDSYFAVKNLLEALLSKKKNILFIEEPENHIDPKSLKKMMNFILYFFVNKECIRPLIRKELEESKNNYKQLSIHSANYTGYNLQVISQRPTQLMREERNFMYIETNPYQFDQVFIISHSPILIDFIANLNFQEKISNIYEVYEEYIDNQKINYEIDINYISQDNSTQTAVSKIRKVNNISEQKELLESLGLKNSDLILSNGIIWVEGPSDVIYIKTFLNMYIRDNNNCSDLEYGRDYIFGMYGGTLLYNYYFYEKSSDPKDIKKIIAFTEFNKNFYIVIDSDAAEDVKNNSDQTIDKSTFGTAKYYIAKEITKHQKHKKNIGIWYEKNNKTYNTIEKYIEGPNELKNLIGKKLNSKVEKSIKVIKFLNDNENIKLIDVGEELNKKIKDIYNKIESWSK